MSAAQPPEPAYVVLRWRVIRMPERGDSLIAAIEAIYEAAAAPALWPAALERIAACFNAEGTVLMRQRADGSFTTIVSPGLTEAARDYESTWWRHDIRAVRGIEQGYLVPHGVYTDRHVATPAEIETHPFYTEFLAKHGLGWFMGAFVSPHPKVMAVLSVQRAKEKGPFKTRELKALGKIAHHGEQVLRLTVRMLEAEGANLTLGDALGKLGCGAFLLDENLRVIIANAACERLFGDAFECVDGCLCARTAFDRAALDAALRAVARQGVEAMLAEPKPFLLRKHEGGKPLVVYILPVRPDRPDSFAQHYASARAIVLVMDQAGHAPADPALVRDLLGLTLGEARVAALIGAGMTPRDAAGQLGIAEETARVVLKRVFDKAGVSRQSELAAMLARISLTEAVNHKAEIGSRKPDVRKAK